MHPLPLFLLLLLPLAGFGQREDANWVIPPTTLLHFGQNGLVSSTFFPVIPTSATALFWENSASISDSSGQLLYYLAWGIQGQTHKWSMRPSLLTQSGDTVPGGAYLNSDFSLQNGAMLLPDPINSDRHWLFLLGNRVDAASPSQRLYIYIE